MLASQNPTVSWPVFPSTLGSRWREGIVPLYSAETPPAGLGPTLGSSSRERHGAVGEGTEKVTNMI